MIANTILFFPIFSRIYYRRILSLFVSLLLDYKTPIYYRMYTVKEGKMYTRGLCSWDQMQRHHTIVIPTDLSAVVLKSTLLLLKKAQSLEVTPPFFIRSFWMCVLLVTKNIITLVLLKGWEWKRGYNGKNKQWEHVLTAFHLPGHIQ